MTCSIDFSSQQKQPDLDWIYVWRLDLCVGCVRVHVCTMDAALRLELVDRWSISAVF